MPGYLGAPRLASAAFGKRIWDGFSAATLKTVLEIHDGRNARSYPRYVTYLKTLPQYREWIATSEARDSTAGDKLSEWLTRRRQ